MSGNTYSPGPSANSVRDPQGNIQQIPSGWILLSPGDAALTRRVKAAGEHWLVKEKKGRRIFSRGVYAPESTIRRIRNELATERSTETYRKRRLADARRREKTQAAYVNDFHREIIGFLDFHPDYSVLADRLASAVTAHTTPVGSGTVARTQRIPVEKRAEAAVIAWLRHQTTAYDSMRIPRIKGKRREVRRMLAERSQELLNRYRIGESAVANCPLQQALKPESKSP
ncbi:MAG: DUF2293 domain-containing protein [Planctomycetaceae bacterium]|nr:DUF2293 domain-containing protein [Planctomycetaceae bacterium]